MSGVANWVRRNRRKLAVGGAVAGGLYVLGRVAESQYVKYKEEENRKLMQKHRKENHFSATEATCVQTLTSLFPLLRKLITKTLDTDSIKTQLKDTENISQDDKIKLWKELKVISVSRCVLMVVGGVYLSIMVRIQLNILAGYLFHQESGSNNNFKMGTISKELQEKFLSICNHFVTEGLKNLCQVVSDIVRRNVENIELTQKLSLVELESLFNNIMSQLKLVEENTNIFSNPGAYFLPKTDDFLVNLDTCDRDEVKKMFAETLDVIECQDAVDTVTKLNRQGLSHIMDNVADYYNSVGQSDRQDVVKNKNSLHDSGFVSPANITLPLAKIIPVLSSQISIDEAEQDMWLCHLSDNQAVKTLGANIYETFCQQSSKTSSSNNDIDNQNETWSSWMFSTAEQLLGIQK